jgi:hypothetical protein
MNTDDKTQPLLLNRESTHFVGSPLNTGAMTAEFTFDLSKIRHVNPADLALVVEFDDAKKETIVSVMNLKDGHKTEKARLIAERKKARRRV